MNAAMQEEQQTKGRARVLRILTEFGHLADPAKRRLTALLGRYPKAQWHQWEPLTRDNGAARGAQLAFGELVENAIRL